MEKYVQVPRAGCAYATRDITAMWMRMCIVHIDTSTTGDLSLEATYSAEFLYSTMKSAGNVRRKERTSVVIVEVVVINERFARLVHGT